MKQLIKIKRLPNDKLYRILIHQRCFSNPKKNLKVELDKREREKSNRKMKLIHVPTVSYNDNFGQFSV